MNFPVGSCLLFGLQPFKPHYICFLLVLCCCCFSSVYSPYSKHKNKPSNMSHIYKLYSLSLHYECHKRKSTARKATRFKIELFIDTKRIKRRNDV